jgi:uncharacterized protein YbbC (DUF1343 family)
MGSIDQEERRQMTVIQRPMNDRKLLGLFALLLIATAALAQTPIVKTGIEVLREHNFDILQGKRVGLITNPSGVDATLRSTIDILYHAPGVKLVALFGPEHGVRGDVAAGGFVASSTDSATGVPIFSLYGKTRKPSVEMLKGIDILLYDIQDVGCRSYTFIGTLGLAMEAAAENHIPFVVLDRPNPLSGMRVEGNIVENGFKSFVSPYPIPYIYGLTCGELARMLNGEGMLANRAKCNLTVVTMKGWKRSMGFEDTGLQWVPTSPHMPFASSPLYIAATGIIGELGTVSVGIGYTLPFHLFGAEWINPEQLSAKLSGMQIPGVLFRPITFTPFYGSLTAKQVGGVQIHITNPSIVNLLSLQFFLLEAHNQLYPSRNPLLMADSAHRAMFDKVLGSNVIRFRLAKRMMYLDVKSYLEKDVEGFRKLSKPYWLYQ